MTDDMQREGGQGMNMTLEQAVPVAGGLRERLRTAVRALFREQKRYHEDLDTMLEIDQLLAKLEYIAGPKAWCPECRAPRLYSGDPDSIHLHLCHTCKGVVDDSRDTAPPAERVRVPDNLQAEIHKIAKKYLNKRKQGHFMGDIRAMLSATEADHECTCDDKTFGRICLKHHKWNV